MASFADDLDNEFLQQPTAEEAEYKPRVEFDGGVGVLNTGTIKGQVPADLSPIFRECLIAAGHDPDNVRIGRKLKESHWEQRARVKEWSETAQTYIDTNEFETVWLHGYKFEVLLETGPDTDIADLVRQFRETPAPYSAGAHWAVFQAGDQQLGKKSSGGELPEIVDRYLQAVENAAREVRALRRHGIEGIQISMPGDCIEGSVSQDGRNNGFLTTQTVPEQTRVLRRLMYETVRELAPLCNQLMLTVVNGNHDQAQRQLNTWPGDGWATECAIEVDDRLKDNPASFGHCQVIVPDKWRGCMTVPVGDTVVTVVHGHQWRRDKVMDWWAGQALGMYSPGAAHILQFGHWHEWQTRTNQDRIAIGSPTFDLGSDWYAERKGGTSRRGGLVYLMRAGEVSRMSLV